MLKKIAVIIAVSFSVLMPVLASAAIDNTSRIPELNPFCWHRSDCERINKDGFVSDASTDPCTGGTGADQWGRCLPAGVTKTEISFGGQSRFSNIGEFILVMYKYLLTIASIVAVVVIIIAGAQWTTSGGNSEAIGAAKKRIGGAVIGLFIAYMSYFVLNTINPALVNLRLPQVWLVKPVALVPEFCEDLPGATEGTLKFAFVSSNDEPNKPVPATKDRSYIPWPVQPCGDRYLAENGGETACAGNSCPQEGDEQKTCFNKTGDRKTYECGDVRVSGNITNSALAKACGLFVGALVQAAGGSPWGCPPIKDSTLVVVCNKNNAANSFGSGHGESKGHYYIEDKVSHVLSEVGFCDQEDRGGLRGFAVQFIMSKDWNIVDISSPIAIVDKLGSDDGAHLVGRGGVDLGETSASAGTVVGVAVPGMGWNSKIDPQYLFSFEEIKKGIHLNIDVSSIEDSNDATAKQKSYWGP